MKLHDEILANLVNGPSTIATLTRKSKLTKHEGRVGSAIRELEDKGLVEIYGRWTAAAIRYRLRGPENGINGKQMVITRHNL